MERWQHFIDRTLRQGFSGWQSGSRLWRALSLALVAALALPLLVLAAGGDFTPHPTTPAFGAGESIGVTLGDLDGDLDLDAVVANNVGQAETVWLNAGTLAAQVSGFQATAEADHVLVTWETVSEVDNQGFNLYRSTSSDAAEATRLNEALIESQAPDSSEGFAYEWRDLNVESGATYFYWLEDVDTNGTATRHGPVSVTYQAPTALTVSALAVDRATPALPWLAGVALGLAAIAVWRRRT